MSDELRGDSPGNDEGEKPAGVDGEPQVAPTSHGYTLTGDADRTKVVTNNVTLRDLASSAISALGDSLVPRIDASWISALETTALSRVSASAISVLGASLVPRIDASWISALETTALSRISASAISALGASLVPRIDASWVSALETTALSQISASAISALGASLLPRMDASWVSALETTALSQINASAISALGDSLLPSIDTSWTERLGAFLPKVDTSWFEQLSWLVQRHVRGLPPNWADVESLDALDDDKLRLIVLDEGIPLAWVPSSALIDRLLEAANAKERRELLRNGWRGVINDCVRASSQLPSRQSRRYARFIAAAASTIRDGHYEAAQALAANLIDTLGRSHVRSPTAGYNWSIVTSKNERSKLSKLEMRALLVLGPLAVGHTQFHPDDLVPRTFSRHATAHGVSHRQYTRVNCLIALMNATALLCWLERDSEAFLDA